MLARTAENLYWLGRLLERAENVARLADVNLQVSTELVPGGGREAWDAVIATLGAREAFDEARENAEARLASQMQESSGSAPGTTTAQRQAISPAEFLIYSHEYPGSLRATIAQARSLARETREYLSREVFEEINRLYLAMNRAVTEEQPLPVVYSNVKRSVAAILGMFDNTVVLSEGREWFRCGIFVERTDMTARIIDTKYFILLPRVEDVGGPLDRYQWMAVLRSASALEAFRKQQRGAVSGPRVVAMLMFDQAFPRSLAFSVAALRRHFERATEGTPDSRAIRAAREVAMLELDLRAAHADNVIVSGLHDFLDEYEARLNAFDAALAEDIFGSLPD
ncbi:MAG: alpha-E domain-containing protein [Chloroflexi bacterium]|nr:alpha-E domain-containing protein [Chloroflexota bacterium]